MSTDEEHSCNQLVEDIIREMNSVEAADLFNVYRKWAPTYEKDVMAMTNGYRIPVEIAKVAAAHVQDKTVVRVIDICAGTGLGGQALKDLGYENIDAIDGCPEMLELARKKDVYKNIYCEFIIEKKLECIDDNTYDVLVTFGCFGGTHLGSRHLYTIARTVKPGGMIFIELREVNLTPFDTVVNLEDRMVELEREHFWRRVRWSTMENYYDDKPGRVFVYERL